MTSEDFGTAQAYVDQAVSKLCDAIDWLEDSHTKDQLNNIRVQLGSHSAYLEEQCCELSEVEDEEAAEAEKGEESESSADNK